MWLYCNVSSKGEWGITKPGLWLKSYDAYYDITNMMLAKKAA